MKKQRGVYRKINLLFKKIDLFEPIKKDNKRFCRIVGIIMVLWRIIAI